MLALLSPAFAASLSGWGVPLPGGGLGGVAGEGAPALPSTPVGARPLAPEGGADVGLLVSSYRYQLDGAEVVENTSASTVPWVGAAAPLGRFGLGATVFPAAARAADGDPLGPGRYHGVAASLTFVEGDLAAAYAPTEAWTFGVAGRLVYGALSSTKSMDTGTLLFGMLGPESGVPLGDPFLEGTIALEGLGGWGGGAAVGARWSPASGHTVDFAARSPVAIALSGDATLVPSKNLTMVVDARVDAHVVLPAEVTLAARLPAGAAHVGVEVGWIGWSSAARIESALGDVRISASDPTMQAVLASYGLTEEGFVDGLGEQASATGMRDVVTEGLWVELPAGEHVDLRAGAWHAPPAVPDGYVHPGNADFRTIDLRAAAAIRASRGLVIAVTGDLFVAGERDVDDSAYAPTAAGASGMALPPADGTYALSAGRLGLTVLVRPG